MPLLKALSKKSEWLLSMQRCKSHFFPLWLTVASENFPASHNLLSFSAGFQRKEVMAGTLFIVVEK